MYMNTEQSPQAGQLSNRLAVAGKIGVLLLLVELLFTAGFHFYKPAEVDLWQGEPSFHLQKQISVIEVIRTNPETKPEQQAADIFSSFILTYHRFPKQGYDITAVLMSLIAYDGIPSVAEQKRIWSALQLIAWTGMLLVLWLFCRRWFTPSVILLGLMLFSTDLYMLMYSTFPRQNMAGLFFPLCLLYFTCQPGRLIRR
jgi:hypothetical protein